MDLHARLHKVILRDPKKIIDLAKDIEIGYQPLVSFIEKKNKSRYFTRLKIEIWVEKKEKEYGMDKS